MQAGGRIDRNTGIKTANENCSKRWQDQSKLDGRGSPRTAPQVTYEVGVHRYPKRIHVVIWIDDMPQAAMTDAGKSGA